MCVRHANDVVVVEVLVVVVVVAAAAVAAAVVAKILIQRPTNRSRKAKTHK
jgi:hypothetical protein